MSAHDHLRVVYNLDMVLETKVSSICKVVWSISRVEQYKYLFTVYIYIYMDSNLLSLHLQQ